MDTDDLNRLARQMDEDRAVKAMQGSLGDALRVRDPGCLLGIYEIGDKVSLSFKDGRTMPAFYAGYNTTSIKVGFIHCDGYIHYELKGIPRNDINVERMCVTQQYRCAGNPLGAARRAGRGTPVEVGLLGGTCAIGYLLGPNGTSLDLAQSSLAGSLQDTWPSERLVKDTRHVLQVGKIPLEKVVVLSVLQPAL